MGRHRRRFADRPRNVEISTKGATTYFFYVFPDGRRGTLGADREDAYAKAEALNGHFAAQRLDMSQLIRPKSPRSTPGNPLLPRLIEMFEHHTQAKTYTDRTRQELRYRLRRYARQWNDRSVVSMTTRDVATFLDTLTPAAYQKHRKLLHEVFQFAAHAGFIQSNPVTLTLAPTTPKKVRRRHTLQGVKAMLAAAPDWLGRAIRLGLYTLQRREDLVSIALDHVDEEHGTITVLQRKTRNYRNPVWIEIEMGAELAAVVGECISDSTPGPFLLRTRPLRMTAKARAAKSHPFAVTPDHLTRSFSELRDTVGAYDEFPAAERPTFHELRALGVHLYTEAGYPKEYVMALSGHATDAMFEHYRADHETKKPRRVAAGLGSLFPEDTRKIPGNPDD